MAATNQPEPILPNDGQAPSTNDPSATSRELRKHLRFRIDEASTSFSVKGVSTTLGAGKASRSRATINLSEGGTLLLVCEPIPVGTPILVRIEIDELEECVEASGVVRWCEQEGRNDKDFHAGIEFIGLSEEDLRKIGKLRERLDDPEVKSRRANRSVE